MCFFFVLSLKQIYFVTYSDKNVTAGDISAKLIFIIYLHFPETRNKFHFSLVMHVLMMSLIFKYWQCAKLFDYVSIVLNM